MNIDLLRIDRMTFINGVLCSQIISGSSGSTSGSTSGSITTDPFPSNPAGWTFNELAPPQDGQGYISGSQVQIVNAVFPGNLFCEWKYTLPSNYRMSSQTYIHVEGNLTIPALASVTTTFYLANTLLYGSSQTLTSGSFSFNVLNGTAKGPNLTSAGWQITSMSVNIFTLNITKFEIVDAIAV